VWYRLTEYAAEVKGFFLVSHLLVAPH